MFFTKLIQSKFLPPMNIIMTITWKMQDTYINILRTPNHKQKIHLLRIYFNIIRRNSLLIWNLAYIIYIIIISMINIIFIYTNCFRLKNIHPTGHPSKANTSLIFLSKYLSKIQILKYHGITLQIPPPSDRIWQI